WARGLVAAWDGQLTKQSTAGAIYVRWESAVDDRALDPTTPQAERRALIEAGLQAAITRLTRDLGPDRSQWRHGRVHLSALPNMMVSTFDLPAVERPGGFGAVNANGANFRRIIDLSDLRNSVASNAPGQSAQPGSPFYGNLAENLGNGEYFPLLFVREDVEAGAAHRLTLQPR
ncbi:MAG: penicillin acylase family protein, partial [Gemmatimonadota bacterium]|nr:penicillin acylase family protein [Gemmatimonadota bacterium]